MALNRIIIKKVKQRTESDAEMSKFLMKLLEFESEPHGWYIKTYNDILDSACKEDNSSANN